MTDNLSLLLSTLMLRPYVFVLFVFHIVAGSLQLGFRKIILFTLLGYFIAFISEFASTRIGIPYGYYYYIETTRDRELWISNVPLMDSLSYTFLAYFSYSMALLIRLPIVRKGYDVQLEDNKEICLTFFSKKASVLALSVILFVLQDVVVDPLALRGSRWFLGQIYGYPYEGPYFGVPLSNFLGWTVVGLVIFSAFQAIDGLLKNPEKPYRCTRHIPCKPLIGPALYFCTMIFNVTITFYIGEYLLGLIGLTILGILLWLVGFKLAKSSNTITDENTDVPFFRKYI